MLLGYSHMSNAPIRVPAILNHSIHCMPLDYHPLIRLAVICISKAKKNPTKYDAASCQPAAAGLRCHSQAKVRCPGQTSQFMNTFQVTNEIMSALVRNETKKGDALGVSRIAGIQAAKLTSTLIPLCHNIPLMVVRIEIKLYEVSGTPSQLNFKTKNTRICNDFLTSQFRNL